MSLSLTKAVTRLPVAINGFSAISRITVGKRNLSRTTPTQFFFNKKSKNTPKFTSEKFPMPNPSFKMGVPQKVMEGTSKIYEPSEIKDMLKFLMGVMPRSGNLISTVSAEGVTNVAPYALCTCISFNPPIISLTVGRKPNGKKDTEINIDETNEFSVNIVTESCLASTMAAAGEFPHNVSEFEKVGFTKKDSTVIKAPLVAQCPVNMECKVISRTPFTDKEGNETCIVYNAEVAKIHILDSIYDNSDARFNYEKFGLIAKLGGFQYNRINSLLEITSAQQ